MSCDNVNEFVNELFESLLSRNQIGLETSMRNSQDKFRTWGIIYWFSRLDKKEKSNNKSKKLRW